MLVVFILNILLYSPACLQPTEPAQFWLKSKMMLLSLSMEALSLLAGTILFNIVNVSLCRKISAQNPIFARFSCKNTHKLIARFWVFIYPILLTTLVCGVSLVEPWGLSGMPGGRAPPGLACHRLLTILWQCLPLKGEAADTLSMLLTSLPLMILIVSALASATSVPLVVAPNIFTKFSANILFCRCKH